MAIFFMTTFDAKLLLYALIAAFVFYGIQSIFKDEKE